MQSRLPIDRRESSAHPLQGLRRAGVTSRVGGRGAAWALAVVAVVAGVGCYSEDPLTAQQALGALPSEGSAEPEEGSMALDLRDVVWTSAPRPLADGALVYAPRALTFRAYQQGAGMGLGHYTLGRVEAAGGLYSIVRTGQQEPERMPNAVLLPLAIEPTLATGDVVLAPRDGLMVPAIVASLRGEAPLLYDLRERVDAAERQFEAPSVALLPMEQGLPGSLVLCADADATRLYQLLQVSGDSLLVLDAEWRPVVRPLALCAGVDPEPRVVADTTAYAWLYGGFHAVDVETVDLNQGRVRVTMDFAGQSRTVDAPICTVMLDEPAFGQLVPPPAALETEPWRLPPLQEPDR
jgi:hypothetical protein